MSATRKATSEILRPKHKECSEQEVGGTTYAVCTAYNIWLENTRDRTYTIAVTAGFHGRKSYCHYLGNVSTYSLHYGCFRGTCSFLIQKRISALQTTAGRWFRRAVAVYEPPSIHTWRYSPFRALASPIRRLHSSLFSALLLHPLIPRSCNASLWTTSAHLVLGLPTSLVV